MSLQRKWYITLMQTDASKSVSLSINKNIGHLIVSVIIISFLVFSVGAYYVWQKQSDLRDLSRIKKENQLLRERVSHFSTQMDSILTKIRIMETWEDNLRQEKKLKIISPDVRALGSGGEPNIDPIFLAFCNDLHQTYNESRTKLTYVMSKINLAYETHFDLVSSLQSREDLYKATPSIWPTFGKVTDKYGYRIHPITRLRSFHAGIDISNDKGTPIYATADGTVSYAGRSGASGNLVRIEHISGYQTRYAHLDQIFIRAGDFVEKGQLIATVGNTGVSTGYHLHYEVFDLKKGRTVTPSEFFGVTEESIPLTRR